MGSRLLEIEKRKRALIGECAEERAMFAEAWRGIERPMLLCNRAVKKLQSPWLWAGVGLVALKLPKKRLLRMPLLLWKGWKLARRVRMAFG